MRSLITKHREYFDRGMTKSLSWRVEQLQALEKMMREQAKLFHEALWNDLRRNQVEADIAEIGYVAREAAYARKHVQRWMKAKREPLPWGLLPGRAQVQFDPLGVCLIIGAWNYPVLLALSPLVAAIAGGNAAVIKPSELAPATADLLAKLVPQYLDEQAFSVVQGGPETSSSLLEERWDIIFFTGSQSIGKKVMAAAAKQLTPVVLELGGKNPAIIHPSADLKVSARRIAQGRFLNAGQTCTAPDYLLVFKECRQEFLGYLKESIIEFYGEDPSKSPHCGKIVNQAHFDRLISFLDQGSIFHGGKSDPQKLSISPTILLDVSLTSPIMQEEIFGPILPVVEVTSVEEAMPCCKDPLSIYIFSSDTAFSDRIIRSTRSGAVVVNDCLVQSLALQLPFGGVGGSGMGKYHGEWGFRSFTYPRTVLSHSTFFDPRFRYPPYGRWKRLLLEFLFG